MEQKSEGGVVDEEKSVVVEAKEELEKFSSIVEQKWCVFTEAQRCELDHQVSIFNHFAYNLPLPHYLLKFSTNMSEYNHIGFDHGTMMDPESNRCRRTDGKKWRCRKNTVPNQKYCERHMHRGRNRSRKPVEISQLNSPITIPTPNTESAVSNPNPLVTQPSDTSSDTQSRSLSVINASSANNRSKNVSGSAADYATMATSVAPNVTIFGGMETVTSDNRSRVIVSKEDDQTKRCVNNMSVKSGVNGSILCDSNIGISTGIGFSPKSVLQVSGCNQSYLSDRSNIVLSEPETGRCRRTDGKKWRCKCGVLPGQKYCATHMHRGAKKRSTTHETATTITTTTCSSAVTVARLPYLSATTEIQKGYCRIPKTKLSKSVPASAALIECNEKNGSCSDTDTNTTNITDTLNECSYVSF